MIIRKLVARLYVYSFATSLWVRLLRTQAHGNDNLRWGVRAFSGHVFGRRVRRERAKRPQMQLKCNCRFVFVYDNGQTQWRAIVDMCGRSSFIVLQLDGGVLRCSDCVGSSSCCLLAHLKAAPLHR